MRYADFVLIAIAALHQCAVVQAYAENEPVGDRNKQFLVFDAMMHRSKPDLKEFGLRSINMVYAQSMWAPDESRDQPRENAIRAVARMAARRGELTCLDIEHWPVADVPAEEAEHSIDKYLLVARWMHHAEPGLRLGFYGTLPVRSYWAPVKNDPAAMATWREDNRRLDRLAVEVDVIFPSLYTFYDDPQGWVIHAEANLQEARRYGKPVYAFLWPEFHDSNENLVGQPIPPDFWRLQLETCRKHADGIVIWGGWNTQTRSRHKWDEDAGWWQQTKDFLSQFH